MADDAEVSFTQKRDGRDVRDARGGPILEGYLRGQAFTVTTFGIWWSLSSPLFLQFFGQNGAHTT